MVLVRYLKLRRYLKQRINWLTVVDTLLTLLTHCQSLLTHWLTVVDNQLTVVDKLDCTSFEFKHPEISSLKLTWGPCGGVGASQASAPAPLAMPAPKAVKLIGEEDSDGLISSFGSLDHADP